MKTVVHRVEVVVRFLDSSCYDDVLYDAGSSRRLSKALQALVGNVSLVPMRNDVLWSVAVGRIVAV